MARKTVPRDIPDLSEECQTLWRGLLANLRTVELDDDSHVSLLEDLPRVRDQLPPCDCDWLPMGSRPRALGTRRDPIPSSASRRRCGRSGERDSRTSA
jgi:hypothetical protein